MPELQPSHPRPEAAAEAEKLRVAVDLVERAELYVVSAITLGLADTERARDLESLRAEVRAVRDFLAGSSRGA